MSSCKHALPVLVFIATLLLPSALAAITWTTKGTSSTSVNPGLRYGAANWVDSAGALWLFGGYGKENATSSDGYFNSLYSYSMGTNVWTLVSGSSSTNKVGTYPSTVGSTGATFTPGGRRGSSKWADMSGNLWVFGGMGMGSTSQDGFLNDLWKFSTATKQWTWVAGLSTAATAQKDATSPSPRQGAASWMDSAGNLYLFGGNGYTGTSTDSGNLNDLWYFNPSKSSWTMVNVTGVSPTARAFAASWNDTNGNGWIHGGTSSTATLSDLWMFKNNAWSSVLSGSTNTAATYPASVDMTGAPGALSGASSWCAKNGDLYLFGGVGYDANATSPSLQRDMWKFSTTTNQWTWVFGTAGRVATVNDPAARAYASVWRDNDGNIILYGGQGYDANSKTNAALGDAWVVMATSAVGTSGAVTGSSNTTASALTTGGATITTTTTGGGATVNKTTVTLTLNMAGDPAAVKTDTIGASVASSLGVDPSYVVVTIKLNTKRAASQNFSIVITIVFPNSTAAAAKLPANATSSTTSLNDALSNFVLNNVTNSPALKTVLASAGLNITGASSKANTETVPASTTGGSSTTTTGAPIGTSTSTTKQSAATTVAPQTWSAVVLVIVVCVCTTLFG